MGSPLDRQVSSAASTKLEVQVTVDLPGPRFRGVRQHGVVYARLSDVIAFLGETAQAFDDAHANADIGKSFRACQKAIEDADNMEVEG